MLIIFKVVVGFLILSTLYWFYLCKKMYGMLGTRHESVYEELGKPTLFLNNTIENGRKFNRFLFKREWLSLDDVELEKHGGFMYFYFFVHGAIFVFLIVGNFFGWFKP
ncbi:hypothetical protein [Reinekea marinisedimentorum]|uniref:Uncharacterized protein n=1 Tax=Reinekea marinisedimentorum TaxID=230495 RepID=A0A4R3HZ02_9GAMM|nr:hypothetical protein [Reinekea marinisedimentorum]TCS36729.1 hypothetical protein BCF53_1223 [Reinekea marinisedimentorum]